MLDNECDIQYLYNKFVNRIAAEVREEERKKADKRIKEIKAQAAEKVKQTDENVKQTDENVKQVDEQVKNIKEHYFTVIINKKIMTMDEYCSIFNISENEIKELGYDVLQKGLITKDGASTFFGLPVDEVESKLKSFQNLH